MSNHELLVAISAMLDEKLKPIQKSIDKLDERLSRLEKRVDKIEIRLAKLEERVERIEMRLTRLEERVERIEMRLTKLEERVAKLEKTVAELDVRMRRFEIIQENDTLPRLQTIESCYIDTSRRYQSGIEQLDAIQLDIDVIKKVICEHSEKLRLVNVPDMAVGNA